MMEKERRKKSEQYFPLEGWLILVECCKWTVRLLALGIQFVQLKYLRVPR